MSRLRVYHNSYENNYRKPFGAVPCGQRVTLRIKISNDVPVEECMLRLWEKENQEKLLPMQVIQQQEEKEQEYHEEQKEHAGMTAQVFEIEYELPPEPGLVWYFFKLKVGGRIYYYGNNREELGGEGELLDREGSSYQITVYKPALVSQWFKKGIMYQILVDRFYNGSPNKEILNPKKKSLLHGDWQDTPFYIKDEQGRVVRWTFFGGNLQGVREKLSYLEELGITVIYFNPIFEAASNHKYDTGDYLKIDPMYGDNEIFGRLVQEAEKHGIVIVLDGVFSHTGSDSIYFNKYGNYPGVGAYQSEDSPYYSWYKLKEGQGEYECWWGVDSLPNVNEMEPSYRKFIFEGEDSVVRYWMRKGVKGWRLDVVDELPDEFVKELRKAVKEENSQAILIGEVWEDASRKVSYGQRREYFWGDELDSAMNYPLRAILLDYILGRGNAKEAYHRIMSLYENYPLENFRAVMNVIGSHDRVRVLTLLGEAPLEKNLSLAERENYKLSAEARSKAIQRLKLLVLLQMTLPGVPCVYYGDEAGVEGFSDPYNRGTFPWGKEDHELQEWYKKLTRLRKEYDIFQEGEFSPFYNGTEVFGFRTKGKDEEIIVIMNRNSVEESQVEIKLDNLSFLALELLSGERLPTDSLPKERSSALKTKLKPLEGKVLFFLRQNHAIPTTPQLDRSCGILLHLTSLPSAWGIGDMGKEAEKFVNFLADSGQELWQILPLNPPGLGFSPYQSPSVFAGNSLLISMDKLQEEGLLTEEDVRNELTRLAPNYPNTAPVNYPLLEEIKHRLLHNAFLVFQSWLTRGKDSLLEKENSGRYMTRQTYLNFLEENKFWLDDYCLYMVLKEQSKGLSWYEWEKPIAFREGQALDSLLVEFGDELEYHRFVQYTFFHQWQNLKKYANSQGIKIIGDLPIYVAGDSCDAWVNREILSLDPEGKPSVVAGVPPDYFSETGQLWGNPLYAWTQMEKDDYSWWKHRVKLVLENYDFIRLDHFRGFEAFWQVPAGESTAVKGRWLKGPGKKFFKVLEEEFGTLPFVAEDLGFLTPEVHNLRNILGFPGMKVYQFEAPLQEGEEVANNTIYYSGTHDTDTLLGWYRKNRDNMAALSSDQREKICKEIIAEIYQSKAPWVIIPMQDILGLANESRMNTPGTIQGNWGWRMKEDDLTENRRVWLKAMADKSGRAGHDKKTN